MSCLGWSLSPEKYIQCIITISWFFKGFSQNESQRLDLQGLVQHGLLLRVNSFDHFLDPMYAIMSPYVHNDVGLPSVTCYNITKAMTMRGNIQGCCCARPRTNLTFDALKGSACEAAAMNFQRCWSSSSLITFHVLSLDTSVSEVCSALEEAKIEHGLQSPEIKNTSYLAISKSSR